MDCYLEICRMISNSNFPGSLDEKLIQLPLLVVNCIANWIKYEDLLSPLILNYFLLSQFM